MKIKKSKIEGVFLIRPELFKDKRGTFRRHFCKKTLKKNNINFNEIILTGGGRKNKYLVNLLKKEFSGTKVNTIDHYNFNGDLIESQMFAYLAVRSLNKLVISSPSSTGVKKSISGGKIYKFTQ